MEGLEREREKCTCYEEIFQAFCVTNDSQKYEKLYNQNHERWTEEYTRAYGRAPDVKKAAAAATA